MTYEVKDASGRTIYEGGSWPMARSALDFAVMQDNGCPTLDIRAETKG